MVVPKKRTTLRSELEKVGFDFTNGKIIYQEVFGIEPGWADQGNVSETMEIDFNHPVLDLEFYDGFGSPNMPRFVAEDKDKIYFPCKYDGLTWIAWIYKNINKYIKNNELTPYIGRG